jgi:hypothetical protein
MKLLPTICIASVLFNAGAVAFVYKRLHDNLPPATNQPEVKVINGKEPVLTTVRVISEYSYGGSQISSSFTQSIRDKSYLVECEGRRHMLYSTYLQSLPKQTVIRGWFLHLPIHDSTIEGNPTFMVPLEAIAIEMPQTGLKVTGSP